MTVLLGVLAVGFAASLGAHYTGACMGMPYALRTIDARRALLLMAPFAWLGAAVASHAVEHTVAYQLTTHPLQTRDEVVVIAVAFALTSGFTRLRVPTSTIQILVFSVAGAALAARIPVSWSTIGWLAVVWVSAPLVALGLGYLLTHAFDRVQVLHAAPGRQRPPAGPFPAVARALVVVGAGASFVMGSNDVANATGALVATRTLSALTAGVLGGGALAAGVLIWGRPLLTRVAFDIVQLDTTMATAAQAVQALVVITAVSFGFFTSMNQALVGAMVGAGAARGRQTVHRPTLLGILRGWLLGPATGIAAAFVFTRLAQL